MYRQDGAIPPITNERIPHRVVVFDTEAYRGEFIKGVEGQSLRLGVARYFSLDESGALQNDEWLNFSRVDTLADFIIWHTRKDKALYVYAHNLKYDLQLSGLFNQLTRQGWQASLFVAEDPPTFIRLKSSRKSILMVDTFNYWQYSLSKMGDQLGLPKLPMPDLLAPPEEWYHYCKRDVSVLSEYLLSFIAYLIGNDLAPLGLTVASQAFRAYRHKFMHHEIIIHSDKNSLSLERQAYSGGRVEAYHIGRVTGNEFYKVDVNSMYPYVMNDYSYPSRLAGYTENPSLAQMIKLLDKYYLIGDCWLNTPSPIYPLKWNDKLIFPVGNFKASLHHEELIFALEHEHIQAIERLSAYDRAPLFTDYVNFFYAMKLKAEVEQNSVNRQLAKLFLNSLYGKFGQREIVSKIVDNPANSQYGRVTGYSESLGINVEVNYLGSKMELRYKGNESPYSFPAISGGVTAMARMYLYKLIQQAGIQNVYYVDTDSLIVNKAGFDNLRGYFNPTMLGMLKLEGVSDILIINGAKDYQFGDEIKHKGLPKSAVELQNNLWQYEQFRGFKSWLTAGLPVGVEVYQRVKSRRLVYNKGIIQPNGEVSPLRLDRGQLG